MIYIILFSLGLACGALTSSVLLRVVYGIIGFGWFVNEFFDYYDELRQALDPWQAAQFVHEHHLLEWTVFLYVAFVITIILGTIGRKFFFYLIWSETAKQSNSDLVKWVDDSIIYGRLHNDDWVSHHWSQLDRNGKVSWMTARRAEFLNEYKSTFRTATQVPSVHLLALFERGLGTLPPAKSGSAPTIGLSRMQITGALFRYVIFLDCNRVVSLSVGQQTTLTTTPGSHSIQIQVDSKMYEWFAQVFGLNITSDTYEFVLAPNQIRYFDCRHKPSVFGFSLALFEL